ncbi:MAG: GTPase HflX [Verrucomicrobia bacterium]|nr:MAG: GTPase HflX [Verrucomicrobiota bacterium]
MISAQDIQKKVTRAFLVGIHHPKMAMKESADLLDELRDMVENLDIPVVGQTLVNLRSPNPSLFVGRGKAESILEQARELEADMIVFDEDLSPVQQRNWESESKLCVIDRQEVILDIFASRARTREAILQVALARMEYSLPRLTRAWTHLSRQRGGGTGMRGQGETQLESDRRMVNNRIAHLRQELRGVAKHRKTQRKKRVRIPVPAGSIVGYTNAGKSSLLNKLTGATVQAEDKLFATLDPTTRQLDLAGSQSVLLTDTVGFIRRLPHRLVEAFKATLEEVVVADFLIQVMDVTSPDMDKHAATTKRVLTEIEADGKRTITVLNKIDLCDSEDLDRIRSHHPDALCVSAVTGEGLEELSIRIADLLNENATIMELLIPHDRYDIISRLHEVGGITKQDTRDEGVFIKGNFPNSIVGLLETFRTKDELRIGS